jgi:hypothetical protein
MNAYPRSNRSGAVERDYPSDIEERWTADRRTRNGKRRMDRFRHDRRLRKTACGERDNWVSASRWNAACQVLDDLALEAIVIVRVRGAAGNLGRIVMRVRAGVRIGRFMRNTVVDTMRGGCEIDEPRQRSDRGPNERKQHVCGEPRAPTPSSEPSRRKALRHRRCHAQFRAARSDSGASTRAVTSILPAFANVRLNGNVSPTTRGCFRSISITW